MDTSTYVFLALVMPLIGSLQQVDAPVPVSLRVQGQGERIEGQPYNLTCVVTPAPASDRAPAYIWFKNGGVLENRVERVLTFERLSAKDDGNYQCVLNQAGNARASFSEDLALRVQNPNHRPIVLIQGQMITGGDLLLSCIDSRSNSSGKSLYLWFRNGVLIRTEPNRDFTLSNVSYEDDGDYTCQVQKTESGDTTLPSNKAAVFINSLGPVANGNKRIQENNCCKTGDQSCVRRARGNQFPPEVFIEEATGEVYKLAEGNNLSLNCLVSNEPKPSVVAGGFNWTVRHISSTGNASDLSDREVSLTDPSQSLYPSAHRADHQLTIVGANRSHSGLYTCHASNDPEKKLTVKPATASIEVQVLYLDDTVTVKLLTKESLVTGSKITLTCTADSLPTATLTWLHQGTDLHTTKGNSDVFTITASGCQDSGDYKCRADNPAANKSAYGFVTATVECPPTLAVNVKVGEPIEVRGILGQEVILSVPVSGTPPLVYTWTGPGVTPSNNRSPTVRLFPLRKRDAGLYSVKVSNRHNFVLQRLQVIVLEEGEEHNSGGEVTPGPKSGGEVTLWLQVVGGVTALILCLALLIALLRCRRGRNQRSNESRDTVGHPIKRMKTRELYDSGRTVADYTYSSGDSSGHYWSIDSADVSRPSQAYQSGDSLIQSEDLSVVGYDVPPFRAELASPRTEEARDQQTTSFATVHGHSEVFSASEDPTMTRRPGLQDGESDPESEDGESYMVCEVLSPGLPPRSQTSQKCDSKTQPDKTLYLDMSVKSQ